VGAGADIAEPLMGASAVGSNSSEALGAVLLEQLQRARRRAKELAQRSRSLEAELEATRAQERAARENLAALEAVAAEAAILIGEIPGVSDRGEHLEAASAGLKLAGSALREMAARVAMRRGAIGRPVHWRQWYGWLNEDGFDAAGKRSENTFLTQLARSPLVVRTAEDGFYIVDLGRVDAERLRLADLHAAVGSLPAPGQTTLLDGLDDARERRRDLQNEIGRSERRLREMFEVLAAEPPPGLEEAASSDSVRIEGWLRGPHHESDWQLPLHDGQ
jgi:hypothetical protein